MAVTLTKAQYLAKYGNDKGAVMNSSPVPVSQNSAPMTLSADEYQKKYGADQGIQVNPDSDVQSRRKAMISAGEAVSVNPNKAEPSFAGKVVRGALKLPYRVGLNLEGAGNALLGIGDVVSGDQQSLKDRQAFNENLDKNGSNSKFFGNTYAVGFGRDKNGKNFDSFSGRGLLDAAGAGAEAASYIVGSEGVEPVAKSLIEQGVKDTVAQTAKGALRDTVLPGIKVGARTGFLGGVGSGAQEAANEKTFGAGVGDIAAQGAEGAVGGAVLGGAVPAAIKLPGAVSDAAWKILPSAEGITGRLAKLTPGEAQAFEKMAGESHGSYLSKTGNIGTPQQILTKEAEKFTQSLADVDGALAQLPGSYHNQYVGTALSDLSAREQAIGVHSPETARINELIKKHDGEGLTMSEINEVKRLYERNVKLDFVKQNLPAGVERATRVDNGLRGWQFSKADELGLKNLPKLNKQTQISKFLINKIGKRVAGEASRGGLDLADWILLSHGNPASIAEFLAKKGIMSDRFQAGVAKVLAKKPFRGAVTPNINTGDLDIAKSRISIKDFMREVNKKPGLLPAGPSAPVYDRLQAPVAGSPMSRVDDGSVIHVPPGGFRNGASRSIREYLGPSRR